MCAVDERFGELIVRFQDLQERLRDGLSGNAKEVEERWGEVVREIEDCLRGLIDRDRLYHGSLVLANRDDYGRERNVVAYALVDATDLVLLYTSWRWRDLMGIEDVDIFLCELEDDELEDAIYERGIADLARRVLGDIEVD